MVDAIYPVGKHAAQPFDETQLIKLKQEIQELPGQLRRAVLGLTQTQLEATYREGGWNIRQIVHHLADSHLNSYIRFKLAVTENHPTIKPYDENTWSDLADVAEAPIETSLQILDGLHERWYLFLKSLDPTDFTEKKVYHPEQQKDMILWDLLTYYTWHGKHHVAQIENIHAKN